MDPTAQHDRPVPGLRGNPRSAKRGVLQRGFGLALEIGGDLRRFYADQVRDAAHAGQIPGRLLGGIPLAPSANRSLERYPSVRYALRQLHMRHAYIP